MVLSPDEYAEQMRLMVREYDQSRPRSIQSANHQLGVSDVGGCPQYAVLMTRQEPFTDSPEVWPAIVGTAVHSSLEQARNLIDPDIVTDASVTVVMPNGVTLTGHPDALDPDENSITDDKTADGLGVVGRKGPSRKQRWQVAMYAKGAVDEGLLQPDPIIRIVWWDRSGADSVPVVWQQQGYDLEVAEATEWLDDVMYAVKHGEDAAKTPPLEWCAKCCPFYTGCRVDDLPEVDGPITDEQVVDALEVYQEGKLLEREAKKMTGSAKAVLDGHSGIAVIDGKKIRLRWQNVNTTHVEAYERAGYRKIDIRVVK